jgi:type VI secretion system secreted protein Hcp
MADLDLFLKIDGIEGEVQDVKHKGELRIEAVSNAVNHAITGAAGRDAGLSTWQDSKFTMWMDKAYPKLLQACVTGDHLSKAVLTFRKAGKDQQEFLRITFSDVLVSSCQVLGRVAAHIPVPTVVFSFNFAQIEEEYRMQKPDGSLSGVIKYSYSIPKAPTGQ